MEIEPGLPSTRDCQVDDDPGVEAALRFYFGGSEGLVSHGRALRWYFVGVVLRFESRGDGAFRNAPHPLSDILRGIA